MPLTNFHSRARRTTVMAEEDRVWVSFYQRVAREPLLAAEVRAQLDADADMKHEHLALYLCCRESLRLHQAREERHQRIGVFVRWLLSGLLVRMPRGVVSRAGAIAVACLPPSDAEPAVDKVRRLSKDPKVRAARTRFQASAVVVTPPGPAVESAPADAGVPEPKLAKTG